MNLGKVVDPIAPKRSKPAEDHRGNRRQIGTFADPGGSHLEPHVISATQPLTAITSEVLVEKRRRRTKRPDICDSTVSGNHIVIVRERVPEAQTNQLGDLFVLYDRPRLIIASYFL